METRFSEAAEQWREEHSQIVNRLERFENRRARP